jgi:L-fuculose-phosphate aldolase
MSDNGYLPEDPRYRLAAARRILYRNGCDSGVAGHTSMRVEGEDAFWTFPMTSFDEALPEHVVKMDFDLNVLEGKIETPFAMGFHAAFYSARSDIQSIIHIHSPHLELFVTAERFVGLYGLAALRFHDQQAAYIDSGTSPAEETRRMLADLGSKRVLLMRNHGAIVVGGSLESVTVDALQLEQAAGLHIAALSSGGSEITDPQVIRARRDNRFFLNLTWNAHMRRLQRSDPDLYARLQG